MHLALPILHARARHAICAAGARKALVLQVELQLTRYAIVSKEGSG